MNLTSLFNFSYLKQNLKKSKVTLAFVLLILPILNFVILLMCGTGNRIKIFGLGDISGLTLFGMYILPIVLSILLFSFLFKKKSVDFMGSMPIDRKTIFFTNTLGGILIIFALLLVTMFLIMIAAWILPNLYIPMGVLLDYFCLFAVSYIFVFTACNIAVSVSGNVITSLIVTALILFFIPYHHYMFQDALNNYHLSYSYNCPTCTADSYKEVMCDGDSKCLQELDKVGYQVCLRESQKNNSYTMPFQVISSIMGYDLESSFVYQNTMIGKMTLLILLYILVGYILFQRKEMEICETSFKKFSTHQIVKTLTLIPIIVLACGILQNVTMLTWILVICLLLVYNFIYDLITRHSIIKIFQNLLTFAGVFVVVTIGTFYWMEKGYTVENQFQLSDVSNIGVKASSFDRFGFGEDQIIPIQDQELVFQLLEGLIPTYNTAGEEESRKLYNVDIELTIHGMDYSSYVLIDEDFYQKLATVVKESDELQKVSLKNVLKNSEIVVLDDGYLELDEEGIEAFNNAIKEDVQGGSNLGIPIHIYTYENHQLKEYKIYSDIEDTFHQYIVKKYNFKANNVNRDKIYDISFEGLNSSNNYGVTDSSKHKKVMEYLLQSSLDYTKPIYKVYIYSEDGIYYYYANVSDEILPYLTSYRGRYYGG